MLVCDAALMRAVKMAIVFVRLVIEAILTRNADPLVGLTVNHVCLPLLLDTRFWLAFCLAWLAKVCYLCCGMSIGLLLSSVTVGRQWSVSLSSE